MIKGSRHSENSRKKISLSRIGKSYPKKFIHPNTLKNLKRFYFKKGQIPHNKGKQLSLETRKKLSIIMTGKKQSKETCEKKRIATLGKKYAKGYKHSKEELDKMAKSHIGIKHKESTKKLLSEQRKGIPRPQHVRDALIKANTGRIPSLTTRKKMSNAHKGKTMSEKSKKLMSEARKNWKIPFKDTKPERIMQIALTLSGIKFEKHRRVDFTNGDYHHVDIFIEPNIIVEVDGVHWHIEYDDVIRDLYQTQELTVMGYHVIRVRDKDILKDANNCSERVIDLIKELQSTRIPLI